MSKPNITDLPKLVSNLPAPERTLAERLLDISLTTGELVVPDGMRGWVEGNFGAVANVELQEIIRVTNRITLEGTLFNSLRASRPLDTRTSDSLAHEISSTLGDPFCRPETHTTHDTFGRIKGEHSTTAANIAKYDAHHAVIVFDVHDPLEITPETVSDYIAVAAIWHEKVLQKDPSAVYPFFMWNCLWRAGGSILHGHAQAVATGGSHYPKVEKLRRDAKSYKEEYGSGYFRDLIEIHRALGLDVAVSEKVDAFVHITPVKEKELVVIGEDLDGVAAVVGGLLERYIGDLGVKSFNIAFQMPPVSHTEEVWSGFPVVVRIVDRGDTTNRTSDIAAMELYAASVVASYPFDIARSLQ